MTNINRRLFLTTIGQTVLVLFSEPGAAKMIEPVTPTEKMMYSTARIVGLNSAAVESQFGTGFFHAFRVAEGDSQIIPVLITNKHVVAGATKTAFVVHTNSNGASTPDGNATVLSDISEWIAHPAPNVDLCALPIGGYLNSAKPQAFIQSLDASIIPTESQLNELSAVEDVIMVGYPNGLWDSVNNFPLIRRGITASHPAIDFNVDGAATTVVDMACFPGSSGSPVFLYSPLSTFDKKTNSSMLGQSRIWLLGVLFSGPTIQADGKIVIKNIPTASQPMAQLNLMMNLGYIVKSKEIARLGVEVLKKIGISAPR